MTDHYQDGVALFDAIWKNSERFELTSIVLAAEQRSNWKDRIEIVPRSGQVYRCAMYYTQIPETNHDMAIHYICYSETQEAPARARRRMDCAHELGHIVLHNDALRKGLLLNREHEIEADWFALCLLQLHGHVNASDRWDFPVQ